MATAVLGQNGLQTSISQFPAPGGPVGRNGKRKKVAQFGEKFWGGRISPQKVPLAPGNSIFVFSACARKFTKCPRPKQAKIPLDHRFRPLGVRPTKRLSPESCRKPSRIAWQHFSSPKVPLEPRNCVFMFLAGARDLCKCPRPKTGQKPTKSSFPTCGGLTKKKCSSESCGKPSRIACYHFLSISGPLLLWGLKRALRGRLACCCCCCCLLDAQAPPQWSNNLINRLKYYVLQLGDPNQDWVLGPS